MSSCSSPQGPIPNDPNIWCSTLAFSAQSGKPGERIGLSNLPEAQPVLYMHVTVPGAEEPSLALIEAQTNDPTFKNALIVPVHPLEPFVGGEVTLELSDGTINCPARTFTIGALPDPNAPGVRGSLARQAAELQTVISAKAQALGIDPAQLKGDLSELPAEAAALGLVQFFVDHPENTNALAVIARRGSVSSNGELVPFDPALMDTLAYSFAFQTLQGSALGTTALTDDCVGQPALSSAQKLSSCMALGAELQELYGALSAQTERVSKTLAPLVIAFPALGTPLMVLGYSSYFMEAALLLEASAAPRDLASLSFTATPSALTDAQQSGRWSAVQVAVADGEGANISEIITGMIDNAGIGQLLPRLGAEGGPLRRLLEYQFEVVAGLVLQDLDRAYGYRLALPGVLYSSYGPLEITAFRESYAASLVGGDELRIVDPAEGTYAPSSPFSPGRVDLVLAIREGYFSSSAVQGAQQITVGTPTAADEPFALTAIDAPPIPWNGEGEVRLHWSGEGVSFPVSLRVRVARCTEFTECDLTGGTFAARANPLVYPVACTTNAVSPPPDRVEVEVSLSDSQGKVTEPRGAVFQCGGSASQAPLPASDAPRVIRGGLEDERP